jgi:hypothetical protein
MWKAISINLIAPIVYLILWLLPRNSGFIDHNKLFIAEFGQGLIIVQFVAFVIGCVLCRKRLLQVALFLLLILFGAVLFSTIGKFNPF